MWLTQDEWMFGIGTIVAVALAILLALLVTANVAAETPPMTDTTLAAGKCYVREFVRRSDSTFYEVGCRGSRLVVDVAPDSGE